MKQFSVLCGDGGHEVTHLQCLIVVESLYFGPARDIEFRKRAYLESTLGKRSKEGVVILRVPVPRLSRIGELSGALLGELEA